MVRALLRRCPTPERSSSCWGPDCAGLTIEMLEDLLTPDDEPEGVRYGDGSIRLASTFSVEALREDLKVERGTPQGDWRPALPAGRAPGRSGLARLLAGIRRRTFRGPRRRSRKSPASSADAVFEGVAERWCRGRCGGPGELGLSVMYELALSYLPTARELGVWLEDWELSLYLDDEIDNRDQLPELWSLMAVLRAWLNPLNRPGLREDISKAWLPSTQLEAVRAVDDRVDDARRAGSSEPNAAPVFRAAASRAGRGAATARRPDAAADRDRGGGLPGPHVNRRLLRRQHLGPWPGPTLGILGHGLGACSLSAATFGLVSLSQRRSHKESLKASEERRRMRTELLGGQRSTAPGSIETRLTSAPFDCRAA